MLELSRVLAGPWAGQLLADLGADVIKVESLAGDDTRQWGPPFVVNPDGTKDAAYFHAANRGKRSVAIDFSTAQGAAQVVELSGGADVLIENFKVGSLAKYGLDYPSLSKLNPGLVYCSITGFGQDGPYAEHAGYDFIVQGMSGIMDLTGAVNGEPQKIGVAFADIFAGLYAVIGIQAALKHRERTGRGQQIDVALLDCMIGVLANQGLSYLSSGESPRRMGNRHPNIAPYEAFSASDALIVIAVGNDRQFYNLCDVLGLRDAKTDPRYVSNAERVQNREALVTEISAATELRERDELLAALHERGVPSGPVNSVEQAFADPQVRFREMVNELVRDTDGATLPGIRTPLRFSDSTLRPGAAPPLLGGEKLDWR